MPILTRGEMEAAIRAGGSVLYKGHIIQRVDDLPSAADLAQGDPEQESAARAALDAQIAALIAQRDRLAAAGPPASLPAAGPVADGGGDEEAESDKGAAKKGK